MSYVSWLHGSIDQYSNMQTVGGDFSSGKSDIVSTHFGSETISNVT